MLSLWGLKRADFAPAFGVDHAGSEIGSEDSLPVSSGAATGGYWTNNMLKCSVGGACGAGLLETDPVCGVNGESA